MAKLISSILWNFKRIRLRQITDRSTKRKEKEDDWVNRLVTTSSLVRKEVLIANLFPQNLTYVFSREISLHLPLENAQTGTKGYLNFSIKDIIGKLFGKKKKGSEDSCQKPKKKKGAKKKKKCTKKKIKKKCDTQLKAPCLDPAKRKKKKAPPPEPKSAESCKKSTKQKAEPCKDTKAKKKVTEKKKDPCKKSEKKKAEPCKTTSKKKVEPCKTSSKKKAAPCKKTEKKKADPCKTSLKKKEDPCKKSSKKKADPCKKSSKKKEDPCKKSSKKKEDPCKKSSKKKEDPCKKSAKKKEDPCKKSSKKKADPCKKSSKKKADPCKKSSKKKEDPCKKSSKKKADPCKKSSKKKEDPCKKSSKKKEDPCKKSSKKKADPCKKSSKKKEDPCKKSSKKKADPCKKSSKKKTDPCKKSKKKNPCDKMVALNELDQIILFKEKTSIVSNAFSKLLTSNNGNSLCFLPSYAKFVVRGMKQLANNRKLFSKFEGKVENYIDVIRKENINYKEPRGTRLNNTTSFTSSVVAYMISLISKAAKELKCLKFKNYVFDMFYKKSSTEMETFKLAQNLSNEHSLIKNYKYINPSLMNKLNLFPKLSNNCFIDLHFREKFITTKQENKSVLINFVVSSSLKNKESREWTRNLVNSMKIKEYHKRQKHRDIYLPGEDLKTDEIIIKLGTNGMIHNQNGIVYDVDTFKGQNLRNVCTRVHLCKMTVKKYPTNDIFNTSDGFWKSSNTFFKLLRDPNSMLFNLFPHFVTNINKTSYDVQKLSSPVKEWYADESYWNNFKEYCRVKYLSIHRPEYNNSSILIMKKPFNIDFSGFPCIYTSKCKNLRGGKVTEIPLCRNTIIHSGMGEKWNNHEECRKEFKPEHDPVANKLLLEIIPHFLAGFKGFTFAVDQTKCRRKKAGTTTTTPPCLDPVLDSPMDSVWGRNENYWPIYKECHKNIKHPDSYPPGEDPSANNLLFGKQNIDNTDNMQPTTIKEIQVKKGYNKRHTFYITIRPLIKLALEKNCTQEIFSESVNDLKLPSLDSTGNDVLVTKLPVSLESGYNYMVDLKRCQRKRDGPKTRAKPCYDSQVESPIDEYWNRNESYWPQYSECHKTMKHPDSYPPGADPNANNMLFRELDHNQNGDNHIKVSMFKDSFIRVKHVRLYNEIRPLMNHLLKMDILCWKLFGMDNLSDLELPPLDSSSSDLLIRNMPNCKVDIKGGFKYMVDLKRCQRKRDGPKTRAKPCYDPQVESPIDEYWNRNESYWPQYSECHKTMKHPDSYPPGDDPNANNMLFRSDFS